MSTTTTESSPSDGKGDALKSQIEEATMKAKQRGFVTMVRAKTFVENNPFQSIAIAVGVGYLVKLIKPGPTFTLGLFGGLAYLATRFEMH